ncbi:MAG: AEC family transporter [Synergistes sp.]|nr:AEC family transporter [Synergistes sp.]
MIGFYLIAPLMLIIAVGNILHRRGFYSKADIPVFTKTLYWVILPPLLFRTTYLAGSDVINQPKVFVGATICFIASVLLAYIAGTLFVHKGNRLRIAASAFASMRSNNVYLGLPVIELALGEMGLRYATVSLAVTLVPFHIISIASAELIMTGRLTKKSFKSLVKKIIANPLILACCFGVGAALLNVPINFVFMKSMEIVSKAATAVALIALGATLDLSGIKNIAKIYRETWFDIIVKLFISPAIMYFILLQMGVDTMMTNVTVMLSAMPTAVNSFIIARGMGMDADYAANLVAAATLLGAFTIPMWAYMLGII